MIHISGGEATEPQANHDIEQAGLIELQGQETQGGTACTLHR